MTHSQFENFDSIYKLHKHKRLKYDYALVMVWHNWGHMTKPYTCVGCGSKTRRRGKSVAFRLHHQNQCFKNYPIYFTCKWPRVTRFVIFRMSDSKVVTFGGRMHNILREFDKGSPAGFDTIIEQLEDQMLDHRKLNKIVSEVSGKFHFWKFTSHFSTVDLEFFGIKFVEINLGIWKNSPLRNG